MSTPTEQFLRSVPMRVGMEIDLDSDSRRQCAMTATYQGEIIYRWVLHPRPTRWDTTIDRRYKLETRDDRRIRTGRFA